MATSKAIRWAGLGRGLGQGPCPLPLLLPGVPSTASSSSMRSTWCRAQTMGKSCLLGVSCHRHCSWACLLEPPCAAGVIPFRRVPFLPYPGPSLILFSVRSSVALWGLSKKRPLALQREAHGLRGESGLEQPFWVSSVAALLNTDLVATGGCFFEAGRRESQGGLVGGVAHCLPVSRRLPQLLCATLAVWGGLPTT